VRGIDKLAAVDASTPAMRQALPSLPMTETVMVRLLRISTASLGQFFEPVFREIGLTENTFHILCLLMSAPEGRASPSELSELVGTSRANMTRLLDELDSTGHIRRLSAQSDGRRVIVAITDSGREAALQTAPRLEPALHTAFAGLDDTEMAQLAILLRKAVRSFDKRALGWSLAS